MSEQLKIRTLGLDDVFYLSEIIDKMGVSDKVTEIVAESMEHDDPQAYAGGQLIMILIGKLHKAKSVVFEWFASLYEIDVKEVKKLSFKELKNTFTLLMKHEDITGFFDSLVSTEKI